MAVKWEEDLTYENNDHYYRVFWTDKNNMYNAALYSLKHTETVWYLRVRNRDSFIIADQVDPPLEYATAMYALLSEGS